MVRDINPRLLALAVVALTCVASSAHAARRDRLAVGTVAPAFTLRATNAEALNGSPYAGLDSYVSRDAVDPKKAVLVSFFASDCEICKLQLPYLVVLHDSYKDKGLQVLSVILDKDEARIDALQSLFEQVHVKFPVLSDNYNYVARRYLVAKLPCVYLIDGDGVVTMAKVGSVEEYSKDLHDEVRKMLELPDSDPVPRPLQEYFAAQYGGDVPVAEAPPSSPAIASAPMPAPIPWSDFAGAPAPVSDPGADALGVPAALAQAAEGPSSGKAAKKMKIKKKAKHKRHYRTDRSH